MDEALPDPTAARDDGVRDDDARPVAILARSGAGIGFVGIVLAASVVACAVVLPPDRTGRILTGVIVVSALLALGVGWLITLVAWWRRRRLAAQEAGGAILFGLLAPLLALAVWIGGAFVARTVF